MTERSRRRRATRRPFPREGRGEAGARASIDAHRTSGARRPVGTALSRRAWLRAALALPALACAGDPETPRARGAPEPTSSVAAIALALGPWELAEWPTHARFAEALAETIELPAHGLDLQRLARSVARQRRAGEPVSLGDGETRAVLEAVALALYRTPAARGALLGEPAFGCAAT